MQAWASMPHSMACLGFPRLLSSLSTLSVSMEKRVLAWGFRSSAPKSGTVGPKPLGYCSVKIGGIPRIRQAWDRGKIYKKRIVAKINVITLLLHIEKMFCAEQWSDTVYDAPGLGATLKGTSAVYAEVRKCAVHSLPPPTHSPANQTSSLAATNQLH